MMPYPNEHACRLRDPGDFEDESFRRSSRESDGKRYDVISGKLKGEDTLTEQAYRYPKDIWEESEAESHCNEHNGIAFEAAAEGEEETDDLFSECCGKKSQANRSPIRCFEGNAKPYEPFWTWRNTDGESSAGATGIDPNLDGGDNDLVEPELELYGYISEYSWFEDDITPKRFKDDLKLWGQGGPITIRMNSGGGDLIAASAIKAILMDYPGRVTVKIDGMAASAATIVAIAGDRIWINESAYMMIHDPLVMFFMAALNIGDLSSLLDELKTAKDGILDAYISRTGLSRERLSRMMSAETWMTASQAVDYGFADKVLKVKKNKKSLQNAAIVNALQSYRNVPPAVMQALKTSETPAAEELLTGDMRSEAQNLSDRINKILKKGENHA